MVKKKVSGQTLAIIILAILLVVAIAFGGVYAFYSERSQQVTGEIRMANLEITLDALTGESGKSEIIIYNKEDIVPGQTLTNSPLAVVNKSKVDVYLIVVYAITAQKRDVSKDKVSDALINPVLGLGTDYINPLHPEITRKEIFNDNWIDYIFDAGNGVYYRCLVSAKSCEGDKSKEQTGVPVDVIPKNQLALAPEMGNEYKYTEISLTFQAFAIAANESLGLPSLTEKSGWDEKEDWCNKIVSSIYESQGAAFLRFV